MAAVKGTSEAKKASGMSTEKSTGMAEVTKIDGRDKSKLKN